MKIFYLIIFMSVFFGVSYGQLDIQQLKEISANTLEEHHTDYSVYMKTSSTGKKAFGGMFYFYKRFISSQDGSSCPFHQSCSVYMIESIKKNGVFKGFLSGIDRLLRCNGHSNDTYKRHPVSYRLLDKID